MIFRKVALHSKNNHWSGKAVISPYINPIVVIFLFLSFLVLSIFVLFFCSYSRDVDLFGEVISIPKPTNVTSSDNGTVTKILVKQGDHVSVGQDLLEINTSKKNRNGYLSSQQASQLEEQASNIDRIISDVKKNKVDTLSNLAEQEDKYKKIINIQK